MLNVLFLPYFSENPYQDELAEGLRQHNVQVNFGFYGRFSILDAVYAHWKPDILHLHWTNFLLFSKDRESAIQTFHFLLTQLYVVKSLGIKIVWTVHELVWPESNFPELELVFHRALLPFYDAIFVHGQAAKDAVIQAYQIPERDRHNIHITAHPNYLPNYENTISRDDARQHLKLPLVKTRFLFFGQIRPYKGVLELIAGFSQLKETNIELLIAGKPLDDAFRKQVERACRRDARITLVPRYVPEQEVQYYLNSADVVVLPFQQFLTSGSLLLAMSFGKAVIAPPYGNILDALDEEGGIFCDPSDRANLVQALKTALTVDLQGMGAYNRKKAESFDRQHIAQQTAALYHALCRDTVEKRMPDFKELFSYFPDEITPHTVLLCTACVIESQVKHGKESLNVRQFCSLLRPIFPYNDRQWHIFEQVIEWWALKRYPHDPEYRTLLRLWTDCHDFVGRNPSGLSLQRLCDWKEDAWPSYLKEEKREKAIQMLERCPETSPRDLLPLLQFVIAKSVHPTASAQIRNFYRDWNKAHPRQTLAEHDVLSLYLTLFGQAILKHKQWHTGMEALKEAIKLSRHPYALSAWAGFLTQALKYAVGGTRKI